MGEWFDEAVAPQRRGYANSPAVVGNGPGPGRGTQAMVAAVVGLAGLTGFELVRAARITARLANEDTSIMWVMARDWIRGAIHQPNYYGQSYGSTLEGVPIGVVHALGFSYGTSTAVVLAGIEGLAWALLAWAAWHRGRRLVAALALAMPVVLAAYHTVYVAIELQAPGPRLLVIAAAALLIALPSRSAALAASTLLLGVGLQLDAASALLAVPLVAWYGVGRVWTRGHVQAILLGSVPPAALFVYTRVFYWRHPDYAFHIAPSLQPSLGTLRDSGHHLGEFFGLYAPEVWRSWLVPVVALAMLVVLLVASRQARYAVPGLLAALLVVYAMSTSRAQAVSALGPLLPRGRILLALPETLWFLCFLAAETNILRDVRSRLTYPIVAALCVASVASTTLRVVDYTVREGFWRTRAVALGQVGLYGFRPNATVIDDCRKQLALARRHHIGLIVYNDQHSAYACAAQAPTGISTLVAGAERRTWVLYHELRHPRSAMIVVHPAGDLCALARQRATCSRTDDYATLTFPTQPALPLLASMGFAFRGFGPHCTKVVLDHCRGRTASLARGPFAAPPGDRRQAAAGIVAAYQVMFDVAPDATAFPTVENGAWFPDLVHQFHATPGSHDRPAVTNVQFLDDHEAAVRYRIGLSQATGEAVVQDGTWRVALPTFCSAIHLDQPALPVECPDFPFFR